MKIIVAVWGGTIKYLRERRCPGYPPPTPRHPDRGSQGSTTTLVQGRHERRLTSLSIFNIIYIIGTLKACKCLILQGAYIIRPGLRVLTLQVGLVLIPFECIDHRSHYVDGDVGSCVFLRQVALEPGRELKGLPLCL